MRGAWLWLAFTAALGCGGYYYLFHYPPSLMKRHAGAALERLDTAAASQDHTKISAFLEKYIADEARITLRVQWQTFGVQTGAAQIKQDLSKEDFITLIGLTLYSLHDYALTSSVEELTRQDGNADITLKHLGHALGKNFMMGQGIEVKYTLIGECRTRVRFDADYTPRLTQADCTLPISMQGTGSPPDARKMLERLQGNL